jgi:hypothetical protein
MRKILILSGLVCGLASAAVAQTVTQPSGGANVVAAADDFATRAFQDPWDMNERTDLGWWIFGSDQPFQNWSSVGFGNGVFTGTTSGAFAGLFLLETGIHETPTAPAVPIGKTGKNYPIDANTYTRLVYRMRSPSGFQDTGSPNWLSFFYWSAQTIFDGQVQATHKEVIKDWAIYDVSLPALNHTALSGPNTAWGGSIGSLAIAPVAGVAGATIDLDWVRLVRNDASLYRTIVWTGSGVDLYLDNDNVASNGTLGRIALSPPGNSLSFFVGALPAGDYYVAVRSHSNDATTSGLSYSPGFYRVNDIPRLRFTTPSDEGSADDFATAKLGNPWDFKSMNDIDFRAQISPEAITSLTLTNEAGQSLGPQTVYLGTSTPGTPASGNVGDPFLFTLFWDFRGKVTRIDPSRYRILTIDAGLPDRARGLCATCGSVARVAWRATNEAVRGADNVQAQTVSEQFVINSKTGENTMAHMTVDLAKMPVLPSNPAVGLGSTPWTSAASIDAFRFDPHEFASPTPFFVKRIKIASLERTASNQFTFRWTYSKSSGTVDLYRQAAGTPRNFSGGVKINGAPIQATAGSYTWNSGGTPDGEYQIFAIFTDGTNANQVYALTNVVVDANNVAFPIVLSRTTLIFGALGPFRTPAQTVRLTFSAAGNQCWQASSNHPGISISPASGNGAANLEISIANGTFPGGTTSALITIQQCGTLNAAAISVSVNAMNASGGPTGAVDSPANGAAVTGSIGVTGWAVDDIGIAAVSICRDPVAGEGAAADGRCGGAARIFIGFGTFVEDARADVEALSPNSPLNYKAGWGYLLLTNFLPALGNGTFTIHAYATDIDGHTAIIGSKTINAQNSTATKPFGAIDTPGQGEVVCGTKINFGWVLTQVARGATIPANASTITVYIDGVPVGQPTLLGGLVARPDIQALFPKSAYNDPDRAVGAFSIDTTQYANGVHAIFWVVSDSTGAQDGIGSRFFTIANPCVGS